MYSDTKKSIAHVVESHAEERDPQLSRLYALLSIQKDRLFAWGLEWADTNYADEKDIDASLDVAGISDLVESIMVAIGKLLSEAEQLRLPITANTPGAFPLSSSECLQSAETEVSAPCAARLDRITSTITTSIDTLCDLSRAQRTSSSRSPRELPFSTGLSKALLGFPSPRLSAEPSLSSSQKDISVQEAVRGPSALDEISIDQLRMPRQSKPSDTAPPSYDSIAGGSGVRAIAQLGLQDILVEYSPSPRVLWQTHRFPSQRRYRELVTALQVPTDAGSQNYAGSLRLRGWFADRSKSRYGYVYELPLGFSANPPQSSAGLIIRQQEKVVNSLLSFLQHGADLDSSNMPALEDRFKLALNLASSVARFHNKGVTHRNLNSTGVVFFSTEGPQPEGRKLWKEGTIRKPFIVAFDDCAEDAPASDQASLLTDIYRHPFIGPGQRTFVQPSHDFYSLGLILLEIGLWMPLHKLWKPRYSLLDFKNRLQTIYAKRLRAKCGGPYMRVVEYCLTAADQHNKAHPFSHPDPAHDPSRPDSLRQDFIHKVIEPLGRCCMLDDDEEPVFCSLEEPPYPSMRQLEESSKTEAPVAVTDDPDKFDESKRVYTTKGNNSSDKIQAFEESYRSKIVQDIKKTDDSDEIDNSMQVEDPHEMDNTKDADKSHDVYEVKSSDVRQPFKDFEVSTTAEGMPDNRKRARRKHVIQRSDIPSDYRRYWENTMLPSLRKILHRVIDQWESYSIDVLMIGESKAAARPTIYMMCDNTEKARKALNYVNRDRKLFDIKVVKGQIERSKARKRRKPPKQKNKGKLKLDDNIHQAYQPKPGCGASIGAYINNQHLPPVSFGGTILIDDQPYAMSVHHMLEDDDIDAGPDLTIELERSMAYREDFVPDWSFGSSEDTFVLSDDEDDGYNSSFSDLSEAGDWFGSEISVEEESEIGDTPGFDLGTAHGVLVTQPAIDDVGEGFFPSPRDKNEEHLLSHKLGHLHASSGIRRITRDGITHEIDWALIKVDSSRSHPENSVRGGAAFKKPWQSTDGAEGPAPDLTSYPQSTMKAHQLGGLEVHALGRTSGLQTGMILPAMSLVKMPGRLTPSLSWTVIGGFGVGGDSGAWIIDNDTNHLCAHVLAWSERNGAAYISPMNVLLDDISETLKAKVSLPTPRVSQVSQEEGIKGMPTSLSCEESEGVRDPSGVLPGAVHKITSLLSSEELTSTLPASSLNRALSTAHDSRISSPRRDVSHSLPPSTAIESLRSVSSSKRYSSPPSLVVHQMSYGSSHALMC